jgi:hypothetical protein
MKRALALVLALVMAGNSVAMLVAGPWWYGAVPGVPETGPFNPHFVKDIGAAYLVAGLGLGWFGWRATALAQGAAMAGATFLVAHGLIHLAEAVISPMGAMHLVRDFPGVLLPAILAAWIAWPSQPQPEPVHA